MSAHVHTEPLPVPEIRLGNRASSIENIAGIVGALFLLLSAAGYFWNHTIFFQSYLFSFLYWSGFTFGCTGIFLLNNTVGGKWGVTTRSFFVAGGRTLWLVILFFIPILVIGMPELYPWMHRDQVEHNQYLWHKRHYLNYAGFLIRAVIYFAVIFFWAWRARKMADQQDRDGDLNWVVRLRQWSAPGLVVFTLATTFAYFDWILSADPQFYSTVYGAMLIFGDVLQSFAFVITVLVLLSKEDRFGGRINSSLLHDLGNLMFAFTIFWTYLSASQLIIIWPADLPQEIQWYIVRVHGGWRVIATGIAIVMFAVPFLALLSQARKRDPKRLIRVAIWIMLARVVEMYWIVMPTWRTNGFEFHWTDAATFLGMGGIWIYLYLRNLRQRPLLPLKDPRIMAPMPEAAH